MKIAVMQPYLFPYLGYFQLIAAVDEFVCFDTVQFIRRGWMTRNRFLHPMHGEQRISLSTRKAPQHTLIRDIMLVQDDNTEVFLRRLQDCYASAPFFNDVFPVIEGSVRSSENRLAPFLKNAIETICQYVGIETSILSANDIGISPDKKGTEQIYDVCTKRSASQYINAIGGQDLYSKAEFEQHGIELSFIQMEDIAYPQFGEPFVPHLSIIDVLMFNDKSQIQHFLTQYSLV